MTSLFRPGPLFHVRVHPKQIAAFAFPDDLDRRHTIVLGFVDALKRGRLDDKKEVSLHGDFLTRVFGDALGYPPSPRAAPMAGSWWQSNAWGRAANPSTARWASFAKVSRTASSCPSS